MGGSSCAAVASGLAGSWERSIAWAAIARGVRVAGFSGALGEFLY